jgi:uncharacterized protein DUF3987
VIDFKAINQAALAQAESLVGSWLPGGRIQGREYVVLNPTRDDRHPGSFKINLQTGKWADFATNDEGGDLISLYAYIYDLSPGQAAREVAKQAGVSISGYGRSRKARKATQKGKWRTIMPPPEGLMVFPNHPELGSPSHVWRYRDAEGRPLGHVCRFETARGKEIRPLTYCEGPGGERAWRWQTWPEPRPLYGLERLASRPDSPILVVEGEKTADAAQKLFPDMVAVTSPGGSKAAQKADWSQLNNGLVSIWSDADDPGRRYAQTVAKLAKQAGAQEVRIVKVPDDFSPGWDLADKPPEGYSAEELAKMLADAEKWSPESLGNDNDDWPEPVPLNNSKVGPLPVEALPNWARAYLYAVAEHVQVSTDMVLPNVLGVVATACAHKFRVIVKPGYPEPVNLYLLALAPPAERKSGTQSPCAKPLRDWENSKKALVDEDIKDALSKRISMEVFISKKRNKLANAKTDHDLEEAIKEIQVLEHKLPEVPVSPQLLADDTTPEACAVIMAKQNERIGIISTEGGIFETLAGRYNKGVPNLDLFLKAHTEEPVRIDRKTGEPISMNRPSLTMCLTTQPDVLVSMAEKPGFRGRGLLGRFLYFLPESLIGKRRTRTNSIPEKARHEYVISIWKLLEIPWAKDADNNQIPYNLDLEPAAFREWCDFSEELEKDLGTGGEFEMMSDWAGKLAGAAARLAGLIHCMKHLDQAPQRKISRDTMNRALTLAAALIPHAQAAFKMMGTDPDLEAAKQSLGWIREEGKKQFSVRDCHRALEGRYSKVAQIKKALHVLEERAFIFPVPEEDRQGSGRKKSPVYVVNPRGLEDGS